MKPFIIHFLHHSGFIVETDRIVLVFDYYRDPLHVLESILSEQETINKAVYFFVSHVHGDHFNPEIRMYEEKATAYFMHEDCHMPLNNGEKCHLMKPGDFFDGDDFSVKMYGSTDAGGSFMVRLGDKTIYHAGDLNWWHWAGEPDDNNREAAELFFKELEKIEETRVDLAFLPVDYRQQVAREWGVRQYLEKMNIEVLVPMHYFGTPWIPSYDFRWHHRDQKIWIPQADGDKFRGEW